MSILKFLCLIILTFVIFLDIFLLIDYNFYVEIQIGNQFYFLYIFSALVVFIFLWLVLRNKSKRTKYVVLTIILFINFVLHFIKQGFEPYRSDFPASLSRSTLQNICAVSTVICPFIYLMKKQNFLHDYMFFICSCGGLAGLIIPTEAIGEMPFTFDVLRFYFCHSSLVIVVMLAAVLGVFRPRLKLFWTIPFLFIVQEGIIGLNECFLIKIGLVKCDYSRLLDRGFRNSSFVFGIRPEFDSLKFLFDPLVPNFFKTDAFNINSGKAFYFPVLWLTIPAIVYLTPLYIILSSPFWIQDLIRRHKQKIINKNLKTKLKKIKIIKQNKN